MMMEYQSAFISVPYHLYVCFCMSIQPRVESNILCSVFPRAIVEKAVLSTSYGKGAPKLWDESRGRVNNAVIPDLSVVRASAFIKV